MTVNTVSNFWRRELFILLFNVYVSVLYLLPICDQLKFNFFNLPSKKLEEFRNVFYHFISRS